MKNLPILHLIDRGLLFFPRSISSKRSIRALFTAPGLVKASGVEIESSFLRIGMLLHRDLLESSFSITAISYVSSQLYIVPSSTTTFYTLFVSRPIHPWSLHRVINIHHNLVTTIWLLYHASFVHLDAPVLVDQAAHFLLTFRVFQLRTLLSISTVYSIIVL